jgi:hypothetical protein
MRAFNPTSLENSERTAYCSNYHHESPGFVTEKPLLVKHLADANP